MTRADVLQFGMANDRWASCISRAQGRDATARTQETEEIQALARSQSRRSYGQFYAESTRRNIDAGAPHPTLGLATVNRSHVQARAQRILADFKQAGCAPHHVVVDYGCGSLWVGEVFMDYLEPGNYVGLDLVDIFYTEGLTRLPPEFLARSKPSLHVIATIRCGKHATGIRTSSCRSPSCNMCRRAI